MSEAQNKRVGELQLVSTSDLLHSMLLEAENQVTTAADYYRKSVVLRDALLLMIARLAQDGSLGPLGPLGGAQ